LRKIDKATFQNTLLHKNQDTVNLRKIDKDVSRETAKGNWKIKNIKSK